MKIFTIEYSGRPFENWANLGDDIQSLAAKRLVPGKTEGISKEQLDKSAESGIISMNGFFPGGAGWPPAEGLVPFFYSFHIAAESKEEICSEKGLAYLRQFEPIGCRDRGTMNILLSHGIKAYYSKCISLTFERREQAPENGRVFLVSLSKGALSAIPRKLRKKGVVVDQSKLRLPSLSPQIRELLAQHLLDTYAKHASLVITSKIHCAMPCIAMGIPVVFIYDRSKKNDYRVDIINDLIGINYVGESLLSRKLINPLIGFFFNWSPVPLDIEQDKKSIKEGYLKALDSAAGQYHSRCQQTCS